MLHKILIFYVFTLLSLGACGQREYVPPTDVIDLGVATLNSASRVNGSRFKSLELLLPFIKPEGIKQVYNPFYREASLKIERLVVDNKVQKRSRFSYFEFEFGEHSIIDVPTNEIHSEYLLSGWYSQRRDAIVIHSKPNFGKTKTFEIERNSKKIYLTYRIVFPNGEETSPYTVCWIIEWPTKL